MVLLAHRLGTWYVVIIVVAIVIIILPDIIIIIILPDRHRELWLLPPIFIGEHISRKE